MSNAIFVRALALGVSLAASAAAWCAGAKATAEPVAADAPVPVLRYQSALAGFRPLSDDKSIPWRQANDAAASFGGWRAYAREARLPEPAAGAASAAPRRAP